MTRVKFKKIASHRWLRCFFARGIHKCINFCQYQKDPAGQRCKPYCLWDYSFIDN